MIGVRLLALAAAVAVAVPPASRQDPAGRVFHSTTQTVPVYATVRDKAGRLVPDLPREAFEIRDNGRVAPITVFSNEIQPLTVVLMLDMSGSMTAGFQVVRNGTLGFINALLPDDRVRIGSFGTEIGLSPHLSGDKALLTRIASEELWPGGSTPLWEALCAGMQSLANEPGRKVVLGLTDGADAGGLAGWKGDFGDTRKLAVRGDFLVYAVGVESLMPLEKDLIELTDETGGGHFQVSPTEDLNAVFARVADELRHQYVLGFTPLALDGKEHKLEVRVGAGMTARTRKSFVAK